MDVNNKRFWKLLEPEHARAQHFCRGLSGNCEDGDDLYQESVLSALRNISQLRSDQAFRTWFYRIVLNGYRNRRKAWWFRRVTGWSDSDYDRHSVDPRAVLTRRDLAQKLLAVLSPKEKALITLFEMEGWRVRELADLFGFSEGAVKVRLSRIRGTLRKQLRKFEAEADCRVSVNYSKENICVAGKSDSI